MSYLKSSVEKLIQIAIGSPNDAEATNDNGAFSIQQFIKRLLNTKLAKGQQAKANSHSMVLASDHDSVLVKNTNKKFRDDFPGTSLNAANWTLVQTGTGQSVSVTNSDLTITSGTTANSETIIRSVQTYTIPFKTEFIASISQRIVNQEIYLEIVDATGGHYARFLFDGTSNTSYKADAANNNNSFSILTVTGLASATNSAQILEIETSLEEINYFVKSIDTSNARGSSATKNRRIPDPSLDYHIQIRVKNGSTAPTSTTSLTIDSILVQDIEEMSAEITGGRGGGGSNLALPVTGTVNIGNTGVVSVINSASFNTENVMQISANTTISGTVRDSATRSRMTLIYSTDNPVTIRFIETSGDSTLVPYPDLIIPANSSGRAEFKISTRYSRVDIITGSQPATAKIYTTYWSI
ncbi:hypothetical protein [Scytonema sp. NUACC26]|uniref:hypothetical protein n=1 Tax=Scytonema sp. NUACC26 TaxID=3140176 RepID=UPI0034DC795F